MLHHVGFFSLNKFSCHIHKVAGVRTSGHLVVKLVAERMQGVTLYRFLAKCSPSILKTSVSLDIKQVWGFFYLYENAYIQCMSMKKLIFNHGLHVCFAFCSIFLKTLRWFSHLIFPPCTLPTEGWTVWSA